MSKYTFLIISVFLLIVGCGGDKPKYTEEQLAAIPFPPKTGLPKASGGFVLAVGDETITAEQIVEMLTEHCKPIARSTDLAGFKAAIRPELVQIIESKISDMLFYQAVEKNFGDDMEEALDKAAQTEVKKFINTFDNDYAKAEKELKQMGMDWQSFKKYQKKNILIQSYIQKQLPKPRPVTYSELFEYYNHIKDKRFYTQATLTFQLIDIQPAKLEPNDPNQNRLEHAGKLADEIMKSLQSGEDFGQLAKKYSHGHRQLLGGLWKPVQPKSLAKPYDVLAAEADKIQIGQIAGPIEADRHIFIMKLVDRKTESFEPFENVQKKLENRILFERRAKAVNEIIAKAQPSEAGSANKQAFVDFCLEKLYQAGSY